MSLRSEAREDEGTQMRPLSRRHVLSSALAGIAGSVAVRRAAAQAAYPSRVIKLIVPWPPGGITDVAGRILAQRMGAEIGQTIVVENRPGASGTIGHSAVAQSEPDGYTLLLATNSTYAMAPYLLGKLPYDSDKAFTGVGLVASSPQVLCVHPSIPVNEVKSFLDYVRARQPDGVSFEQIEERGANEFLDGLSHELKTRTYAPNAVRRVMIPKPGKAGAGCRSAFGQPGICCSMGQLLECGAHGPNNRIGNSHDVSHCLNVVDAQEVSAMGNGKRNR